MNVEYKLLEVLNWLSPGSAEHRKDEALGRIKAILAKELAATAKLNRIELAKDIKHRHWANDKLRDAYLDAVIEVAKEQIMTAKTTPNPKNDPKLDVSKPAAQKLDKSATSISLIPMSWMKYSIHYLRTNTCMNRIEEINVVLNCRKEK